MAQRTRSIALALAAFGAGALVASVQLSCGAVESACAQENCPAGPQGPAGLAGPAGPAGVAPAGSIVAFAGTTAPEGWLLCDGAEVSRTTYADLFAVVGITYGPGDAINTFNLPDLRGRVALGAGKGPELSDRVVGATGGEERHTLTVAEMPAHHHQEQGGNRLDVANGGAIHVQDVDNTSFAAVTTANTGGGQAHNVMPPFVAISYLIKK